MWENTHFISLLTLSYLPHGHCYLWQTPLVSLHVSSNSLIAIAYLSIPTILFYFVIRRQDFPFQKIFILFGAFIVLCGVGHLLDVWTLWYPHYWISGIERALTAIVSCYTAASLITVIPQFLTLKTAEELEIINQQLQQEIYRRHQSEEALHLANESLEKRVEERTIALERINQTLQAEIEGRKAVEFALRHSEQQEREKAQSLRETLQKLRDTQWKLIQAEKMAFLGFSLALDLLCIANTQGYFLGLNSQWEKTLGYPLSDLEGAKFLDYVHPDDTQNTLEALAQLADGEDLPYFVNRYRCYDGSYRWLEWRASPSGQLIYAAARDITDRKQVETQMIEIRQRLALATNSAHIGIWDLDLEENRLVWDDRMLELYGLTLGEFDGAYETWQERLHPEDRSRTQAQIEATIAGENDLHTEFRIIRPDGQVRFIEAHGMLFRNEQGRAQRLIGVNWDISDRKESEEHLRIANQKLQHLAQTDSLTHLANRRQFDRRLQQEWEHLQHQQLPLSLILIDVDYFKNYNDCYGHLKGDECLFNLAQAIAKAITRSTDLVARYGGEEFIVLLPFTNSDAAMQIAERIKLAIAALNIAHQQSDISNIVTISAGIASTIPTSDQSPENLVNQADEALYKAKQQGRNRYILAD